MKYVYNVQETVKLINKKLYVNALHKIILITKM